MKLYESISKAKGGELEIKGTKITLDAFTLDKMMEFESKGIDLQKLMEKLQKNPATYLTEVAFVLLSKESKEEFNNDISIFRQCLEIKDLQILGNIVSEIITNSVPKQNEEKEKNAKSPVK